MVSTQIKNSFSSVGEIDSSTAPSSLLLKLAVTPHALRYFVISKLHQRVIYFGNYDLHHVANTDELAKRVDKIYEKDEALQLAYGEILIALDTRYSLLPTELSFLTAADKLAQKCGDTGLELIFDKEEHLITVLSGLFAEPKFVHLSSTFINTLPHLYNDDTERLFINVAPTYFDIIHFSVDKTLKIMNRYEYRADTDFIYYVLLYCDEMKLNRESIELILIGEVNSPSKIYDVCYRYFSNIRFIDVPEKMSFTNAFNGFQKHLHFNLYNLSE